ncbi:Phosphoenolpyruvate synthase [Saccharothrix espanaensis DSM 44229]|uniref:Phosphoenolpyruvate synthase n=2 Tax=Saccharothrix espanaensis TaxID=103731 RepID=K0K454_SACES|nr:Phosphoenolpyruvate synthase [Saccharothrix espanaensis DSM 44229]
MLTRLSDATRSTCGGKAATLGVLLRGGLPVPDGFVVPAGEQRTGSDAGQALRAAVARELGRLGDPVVAVRSSAANEDTAHASAAGQYESVIGVRGPDDVCEAIAVCRASARATRVAAYRDQTGGSTSAVHMAVLVQRVIEADVSGVMFTPEQPGGSTRIEASWGLGVTVVSGIVTPDTYEVAPDGSIACTIGGKETRVDLGHERSGVVTSVVAEGQQAARTLDDDTTTLLAGLGSRIAAVLDGPQDIEWAVAGDKVWIVQSRPITASLPAIPRSDAVMPSSALRGTPGSHGVVTATARIVRGPSDFQTVRSGEVVVCRYTDPAWTPLFTIASGVVTETGGSLSHAAIVAREYGIPAVLRVADATTRIRNGDRIALDGTAGTVTVL